MFNILPFLAGFAGIAAAVNIKVSNQGGNATSPLMYGVMFEDVNHSGDGGIYAELIQNRAFQGSIQNPSNLKPWTPIGDTKLSLQNTSVPLSWALPLSVNVVASGTGGLQNPGYWGISVKSQTYKGSFWALGDYAGIFTLSLKSASISDVWGSVKISSKCKTGQWIQHTFSIQAKEAPNTNNTFILEFEGGKGSLNLNLISLFPPTYNNRPNGLRPDLMKGLKELNPSFLRMPGASNLQGNRYHFRWRWNQTIGPLTERPGRPGVWTYQNTDGMGLVEYLQMCDDLKAEPILAVWSGVYLQGDGAIPEAKLAPYVEEVINELEFIMGSTSTKYGALRASLGFPNPWKIRYVEIGNEDNYANPEGYASYRFRMFHDAIRAAYPSISIMSSIGDHTAVAPGSSIDYHEYNRPNNFASEFTKFDNVDRSHKILIGEYASIQCNAAQPNASVSWSVEPFLSFPNWVGAVGETIYTLGAERNGDVVIGASYAPVLQHLNSTQWIPDLITFTADPAQNVFSTSYYAIQFLSAYRYTHIAPMTTDTPFGPAYYVAGYDKDTLDYTFKAALYNTTTPVPFEISFASLTKDDSTATLRILSAPDGLSSNVPGGPNVVRQETHKLNAKTGVFSFSLKQYDIAILTTKSS
ncbi:related to alpha-N-arabinofuranosidase A precursor [Rhynchosporium secalis]|uniref:non-reducing end alpha-L-arabinofuranosidase n=1 Tax=Rhynchosporium secalis TaxID=38038 RepID=A0A1E1MSR7_RHYSE|nr:related to alpha-N-arabinofuranosidase A precursor [Rhynchosporium secalis]